VTIPLTTTTALLTAPAWLAQEGEESPGDGSDGLPAGVQAATDYAALALRILLVVFVAVVVRVLIHRAIRKIVDRAVATPAVPEALRSRFGEPSAIAVERRRQRAETVGSILRSTATFLVFGVAFATILGELEIDLRPVIASAGIVGLAVGFGAQNLVRDFLNGIFMILEDQYGVGDAVDVGEASGIVESVGLRTTRLRNVDGTVWHVRNGEIVRVGNMSQGWSRALIDISVAYGTDVDLAQEVIKRTADEVRAGEEVGHFVLDEPEVWGVELLAPDGITIRLVVKTAPLEQWKVARELRRRLKEAFDAEGIEIPFPQRALWLRTSPDAAPSPVTDLLPDTGGKPAAPGAGTPAREPAAPRPPAARTPSRTPAAPDDDRTVVRRAMRRPDVAPRTGEADAARSDTGVLRLPGPVSPTGPAEDGPPEEQRRGPDRRR
jgi:moderate conductance mechanosensitive channel